MTTALYFEGAPCPRGHTVRYTRTRVCVVCARFANAQWRAQNAERHRQMVRDWAVRNPERINASARRFAEANPDKIRKASCLWGSRHPERRRASTARKKAARMLRAPAWANHDAISFFYDCCPAGCHVDHTIPLQGQLVSGLHIETNLQWLPASDNCRKRNKFEVQ